MVTMPNANTDSVSNLGCREATAIAVVEI